MILKRVCVCVLCDACVRACVRVRSCVSVFVVLPKHGSFFWMSLETTLEAGANWLWVKSNTIFRCTTHFRTCFSGDWDVHWVLTGILTHGQLKKDTSHPPSGPSDLLRQNFFGGRALHVASISENPQVTRRRWFAEYLIPRVSGL